MIRIVRHTLAARWASFVGSFVALALGVALFAAAGLALMSALEQQVRAPQWYHSPDVVVAGPSVAGTGVDDRRTPSGQTLLPPGERGQLPSSIPARLGTLPGVDRLVTDRAGFARSGAATEAHPWTAAALHPYVFVAGGPPVAADQVVVSGPDPHRPGDGITVDTVAGPRRFTVSGVLRSTAPPALYVTEEVATELAYGRIAAVALFAAPGTDADTLARDVRAALADQPQLRVLTGDERGGAEPDPAAGLLVATASLLGSAAGLAGFVSAYVVAGTFAFTVAQRRREFALLRAAGATGRQVRRLVLGEAVGTGVAAGLAGCGLGVVLAPPLADWLVRVGLAPDGFTVRTGPLPLLVAFGAGLLVAVAGAWLPARRAGTIRPVEALRTSSVDIPVAGWARRVAGLACLLGAGGLTPLLRTPEGAAYLLVVAMLLILGGTLLAPVLVAPLVRLLSLGARGPVGILARQSALTAARRTAATAAPVLVTVGLASAALAGTDTLSAAQARSVRDHVAAPLVVLPQPGAVLSGQVVDAARAVPGVAAAMPVKQTFGYDRQGDRVRQRGAWYLDGASAGQALRFPVTAGTLTELTGDTVAVTGSMAGEHGWRLGDTATLWLGDGAPVRLRIVAIVDERLGLPAMLLPWSKATAHSGTPVPDAVYVAPRAGADPAVVRRAVADAVGPLGGRSTGTDDYLSTLDAEFDRLARLALLAIVGLALVYTALSIANTHYMATAGRKPDLAVLRLAGATVGQVLRIVAREAALASGIGVLLAFGVLGASLAIVTLALRSVVSGVPVVVPWPVVLPLAGGCVLVALCASVAPLLPALRRPPGRRPG